MVFMCHLKALVRVYEVSAMKFSQRLEIRQGQSLVMTPQLLQAIKLLQLPTLDLAQFIEQELESNPLLERVNDDDGPDNAAAPASSNDGEREDWFSESLNENGAKTFTVTASDGALSSSAATVTVTLTAMPEAPVNTVPGALSVAEDTALALKIGASALHTYRVWSISPV